MDPSLDTLLETAVAAARAAGDHARDQAHRRHEVHQQLAHDLKLELDLEAQDRANAVIHARHPDHAILGEESRHDRKGEGMRWIVDPIDGTINFSYGQPIWCSSVAVERDGQVLAGAVYSPDLNELFTATAERPSELNGKPIAPSTTDRLEDAYIVTGINKDTAENPASLDMFNNMIHRTFKVRILGAAAIDLCSIACGRADGYVEMGIHLWDVAAAGLIIQQAGGRYEVMEDLGDHRLRVVATNGLIQSELVALYRKTLAQIQAQ